MKKLLTAIFTLFCITANAQHLQFLGIPINSDVSIIQNNLEKRGYKHYLDVDGRMVFEGGTFHDRNYVVRIGRWRGKIESIKLECPFYTYEEAIDEMNELVEVTQKKHPNYEKFKLGYLKNLEEKGLVHDFRPKGNDTETLTIGLWIEEKNGEDIYYVQLLYRVKHKEYRNDDL